MSKRTLYIDTLDEYEEQLAIIKRFDLGPEALIMLNEMADTDKIVDEISTSLGFLDWLRVKIASSSRLLDETEAVLELFTTLEAPLYLLDDASNWCSLDSQVPARFRSKLFTESLANTNVNTWGPRPLSNYLRSASHDFRNSLVRRSLELIYGTYPRPSTSWYEEYDLHLAFSVVTSRYEAYQKYCAEFQTALDQNTKLQAVLFLLACSGDIDPYWLDPYCREDIQANLKLATTP